MGAVVTKVQDVGCGENSRKIFLPHDFYVGGALLAECDRSVHSRTQEGVV
jgi:hypothetical protein